MITLLPERMCGEDKSYKPIEEALTFWPELTYEASQPENSPEQALWDAPIYEGQFKQLLDNQTASVEKARLLAVSSPHSSDWLNCIPIKSA